MSYFLFVDDSRIEEMAISGLGGLLVESRELERIRVELRKIKMEMCGDEHVPIKWNPPGGNDLLFQVQRSGDKNRIRNSVCNLLGTVTGVLVITLIDEQNTRLNKKRRLQYLRQGFEFLCQRTEMHLAPLSETATIIAEVPGSGQEGPLSRHYEKIRREGSSYPTFDLQLTHLDRTLFFSHDFFCEGLQLVDFAVGAICHAVKGRGYHFFKRFHQRIRRHRGSMTVKGYGIVVYPSNSTIADSLCTFCSQNP